MKKHILLLVFLVTTFYQASSASNFKLTITFDLDVYVKNITPHFYSKSGNYFENISYSVNKKENTITLVGNNSYVLYVDFPVLVFSEKKKRTLFGLKTKTPQTNLYYLVSRGITSYTGKQLQKINFSKEKDVKIIIAKQEKHNELNSHKTLIIEEINTYNGDFFCCQLLQN
ncbi:MAG: hypothetical protein QNK89_03965 [Lacinutrix sp.]|uniref:hypothetical protein n=1 Tax=Lacinutrix sp. TaxID=1937692 RepID=UPI0030B7AADD